MEKKEGNITKQKKTFTSDWRIWIWIWWGAVIVGMCGRS